MTVRQFQANAHFSQLRQHSVVDRPAAFVYGTPLWQAALQDTNVQRGTGSYKHEDRTNCRQSMQDFW